MKVPNTHRFFVSASAIGGDAVLLDDAALAHQISGVLRLQAGERVLLLDDSGSEYTVVLTEVGRKRVVGQVESSAPGVGETQTQLTLYVALLRGERFEWVLQKGTELGVAAFVPVQCARSIGGDRADERKLERWRRIVREAAEQSCRARLPRLDPPLPFDQACAHAASEGSAFLLYEGEAQPLREAIQDVARTENREPSNEEGRHETRDARRETRDARHGEVVSPITDHQSPTTDSHSKLKTQNSKLGIFSGPEGGIAPEELTSATQRGIIPVSLGPRILRAETAPIAAAAAIMYALGEL